jgi:TetR/AcrR family transcriptional repressor of multidrug resistance operon
MTPRDTTPPDGPIDRPAAIRRALRELVAEHGFHGASMAAVAKRAGVATGTAYVHYASKDDLIYATYLEIKAGLAADLLAGADPAGSPRERFDYAWRTVYRHFSERPDSARFLTQIEESPYFAAAHRLLEEKGEDPLLAEAARPEVAALLVPLPIELLYSLSFGLAVRMAASGTAVDDAGLTTLLDSCWRAITRSA